ncbi:hypothetical protein LTR08_007831 [Meristemomyces frigidus]|nr:hypothetical protein LTR08_007831 [Meristemomyces frigidus]
MADPFTPRTPPATYLHDETGRNVAFLEEPVGHGAAKFAQNARFPYPYEDHLRAPPMPPALNMNPDSRIAQQGTPAITAINSDSYIFPRLRRAPGRPMLSASYGQRVGNSNYENVAVVRVKMPGGTEVDVIEVSKGKKDKRRSSGDRRDW